MGKIIILTALSAIFFTLSINAHPDGTKPFWYPAEYIYGFVSGCASNVEIDQLPFTREMWPDQVKEVCGCILDGLRHSVTWLQMSEGSGEVVKDIVAITMPMCVTKVLKSHPLPIPE